MRRFETPEVDVAIVTYNTRALTVEAIGRVLAADPAVDLRILVHDNASTDGTVAAVRAAHPSVDVVAGDRNVGFAAGANRLLARSDAPWVLLLNSDAWPQPGAVTRLLAAAATHPEAAVVVPRLERPDGTVEHSTHPFPSLTVAAMCAVGGYERWGRRPAEQRLLAGAWHHDRPRAVDWAVGAAWLLRRAAIDAVGPLDERYFFYAEDVEWCLRARAAGWTVWFEPTSRFTHVGGASSPGRSAAAKATAYLANTNLLYRRAHGLPAAVAYRGLNALGAARLWAGARLRRDHDAAALWRAHVAANLRPARPAPPPGVAP